MQSKYHASPTAAIGARREYSARSQHAKQIKLK
jgi:hypothetical protein